MKPRKANQPRSSIHRLPFPMNSGITSTDRCLLVAAAPKECAAMLEAFSLQASEPFPIGEVVRLDDRFDVIRSGVGKSAAAASTARALTLHRYRTVISGGIAGSLPSEDQLSIGDSIAANRSQFSDEGVGAPDGFIPISELGFAPFENGKMGIDHDSSLTEYLGSLTDVQGIIATVSWCSGDDGCARGVVARTGAIAEAMEGAAVAVAAQLVDSTIRTGELRVISNTTGNRAKQIWDLDASLSNLTKIIGQLR
jgi:futalosine hydrolase